MEEKKIIKDSIQYIRVHELSSRVLKTLDKNNIKLVHSVCRTLINIFNNKTQVAKFDKMGVIYKIVCDTCKQDKKPMLEFHAHIFFKLIPNPNKNRPFYLLN